MKNIYRVLSFVFFHTVLLLLTVNSSYAGSTDQLEWPFPRLSTQEREARLVFFMKEKTFFVARGSDSKKCSHILSSLQGKEYKILTPSQYGSFDAVIKKVGLSSCQNITPNIAYYSLDKGALDDLNDTSFLTLSVEEKKVKSDYHEVALNNIEVYDFSEIFSGKRIWGVFSEGGGRFCNKPAQNICKKMSKVQAGNVLVGTVFDVKNCKELLGSSMKFGSRMRYTSLGVENEYLSETAGFYAFISVNDELYRVQLKAPAWHFFNRVLSPNTTQMLVEGVSDTQVNCHFSD